MRLSKIVVLARQAAIAALTVPGGVARGEKSGPSLRKAR
jgi:hypothetical protein